MRSSSDIRPFDDPGRHPIINATANGFRRTIDAGGFPCPFVPSAIRGRLVWVGGVDSRENEAAAAAHSAIGTYLTHVDRADDPDAAARTILLLGVQTGQDVSVSAIPGVAWSLLKTIQQHDRAAGYSTPPEVADAVDHPQWAYCLFGVPLFVNISSAGLQRRRSRNLGYGLTLVIQPREGVDHVTPPGDKGAEFLEQIRRRVDQYDTICRSPALKLHGDPSSRDWEMSWLGDSNESGGARPPFI